MDISDLITKSRSHLVKGRDVNDKIDEEGGCGVIGFASSAKLPGKHLLTALEQMKNRGNGKGGGVAILGLEAKELGIDQLILENDYLIQIAYLDLSALDEVEEKYIFNKFIVDKSEIIETIDDYTSIGLDVKPPEVKRYFCRIKPDILHKFVEDNEFIGYEHKASDEFVYQNSYALNAEFYASLGDKRAFVLCHSKNLVVFKLVGYGDQVIQYYKLNEITANIWIGHHRYPTKGTVWHPGGAHPFIGMNEALVHNGDFSNHHSVSEYLSQRNIYSLFLTDTEVAAYLFDLYSRIYEYPTEYLIEAIAPTTERDFWMLPEDKRRIYSQIQLSHISGSPDGPWFFIVGRSKPEERVIELLGITDTSMLRPQVFALQEGEEKIGLIASEKQAIDSVLRSLNKIDNRFASKADLYWNARGGSYNDGGAFVFSIDLSQNNNFVCSDKFGNIINVPSKILDSDITSKTINYALNQSGFINIPNLKETNSIDILCKQIKDLCETGSIDKIIGIDALTSILDKFHLFPNHFDGSLRQKIEDSLSSIFRSYEKMTSESGLLIDFENRNLIRKPNENENYIIMDCSEFPAEGDKSAASTIVNIYQKGWKRVFSFNWRGQRFCGSGLGPNSHGFRVDTYGDPGDYLASGLDGAEIYVHSSAQDQIANMMKSGKLVIYGDVGQTFLYGAKGGEVYVLGNAAGRSLINAVGRPRVIINGTALDYLAESFMAGDPFKGGGFVLINGLSFNNHGEAEMLPTPYYGGNLFSLASGGAIYIRDPDFKVDDNQLNGGKFTNTTDQDWQILRYYLEENEKYFGIPIFSTSKKSEQYSFENLYRKIEPVKLKELSH